MRQAIHIFRKDIRCLWVEIAIALAVAAAFAYTGVRRASWLADPGANRSVAWTLLQFLVPLVWWTLIARVIHSEFLPGDRQFWLTRPYRWKSLLAAKFLFVGTFINLPLLVADGLIIHAHGFDVVTELQGLLWRQVLLTVGFVLPVFVLAALTSGTTKLLVTMVLLAVAVLGSYIVAPQIGGEVAWLALNWVRSQYTLAIVILASAVILVFAYAHRRVALARGLAVIAGMLAVSGNLVFPWTAAWALQSRIPEANQDLSSVKVNFESARKWAVRALIESENEVRVSIPLVIEGVPPGMTAKAEALTATIRSDDGSVWNMDRKPWRNVNTAHRLTALQTTLDGSFYRKVKDRTVRVRGSLFLTLWGNRRSTRFALDGRPIRVPDVGICSASNTPDQRNYFVLCSSAFRRQSGLVSIRFIGTGSENVREATSAMMQIVSYSPLPAELSVDPVNQYFTFSIFRDPPAGVVLERIEPVAHIRREFEFDGLRLGDYEVRMTPGPR